MTLKVHINPMPAQTDTANGVGQVVHAQYKYLPQFGIELVADPDEAEIIACHIQQGDLPRVDILHSHGLYWTGDPSSGTYSSWHHTANARILDAARKAYLVTVPSVWVAQCFKRDMRINPVVIGHGIDVDSLPLMIDDKQGYILWNKNRSSDVCSTYPAEILAARGFDVVSTFGNPGSNMRVIGNQPHDDMMRILQSARYYLATTKETFGIGTLEAMAMGIPVIGYNWGGTAEIVTPDCGVLVEPGDIRGLAAAITMIDADYLNYKYNCADRAAQFTWQAACEQYAKVYHQAAAMKRAEAERNGVSVVITNYNYAQHVSGAIRSVFNQTLPPVDLIVVDDGSGDDSPHVISETIGLGPMNIKATHIQIEDNQGVAAARNNGIAAATQNFIVCLDADDKLAPDYLKTCHEAMIQDRSLGVAYTGLSWIDSDPPRNIWHAAFSWEEQATPGMPPRTTIPCAAMFRRDMWQRAGGYQQIYAPGEDTEFFTRGLSVGYTARQVTQAPLFLYRNTPESASKTKPYRPIDTWHPWMRDKLYPMAAPARVQPLVRSYSEPLITVVIPVGPGHSYLLPAAIDSLLGQTFRNWALVVVDDSGYDYALHEKLYQRYPFMTLVGNHRNQGAGAARNLGLSFVTSPLVLWLDADDYLLPHALQTMLDVYLASTAAFVYTDWYETLPSGQLKQHTCREYDQLSWLDRPYNPVTVLMAADDARAVNGFDPTLATWEDWDFFIKLAIAGYCGQRLAEPLLVYRPATGSRRELAASQKTPLFLEFHTRYAPYMTGEIAMSGCGSCGDNGRAIIQAKQAMGVLLAPDIPEPTPHENVVRMEYIGANVGAITFHGYISRTVYRGGLDPSVKYINADPRDVEHLTLTGSWKAIAPMPKPAPPRIPVADILADAANRSRESVNNLAFGMALAQSKSEERAIEAFNPGPLPLEDDGITPEQEAEMNRMAIEQARKNRKAS